MFTTYFVVQVHLVSADRSSYSDSMLLYIYIYVMIFLLKQRLCIKIDFYDNSQVLDFYDYESHKIIQINHFLIFTWSKKSLLDFYS